MAFVEGSASGARTTALPGSPGASTPPQSRSPTSMDSRGEGEQGYKEEEGVELTRIRKLLRPPPIAGISDWGIPQETEEECDANLEVRTVYSASYLSYLISR